MIDISRLMEMLCTRLCHDLTGPIGAVNNGVEFLGEESFDMHHEAFGLIATSAAEAMTRLQFYRQAFGRANSQGEADIEAVRNLAKKFLSSTRISLDWPDAFTNSSGVTLHFRQTKLILNLLLVAISVLVKGGAIQVRLGFSETGERQIILDAHGEKIKEDINIPAILDGVDTIPLSPENAIVYYARFLIEELGATLHQEHSATHYMLKIQLPSA